VSEHCVFVYGTLLAGEPNHRLLQTASFEGPARTADGFALFDLGAFPGMVRSETGVVHGEVYRIDDRTLAALDRLEGHPDFYERTLIGLEDGREVWAYLLDAERVRGRTVISTGSWQSDNRARQHKTRDYPPRNNHSSAVFG
jgi:gamma-glutamylaminecyclotransferase